MRYNCFFDTYRRSVDLVDSAKRIYSATKTVTGGVGAIGPVTGELRPILGLDEAVIAYYVFVEGYDIVIGDKLVVSAPAEYADSYYVEGIEVVPVGLLVYRRLLIRKDG